MRNSPALLARAQVLFSRRRFKQFAGLDLDNRDVNASGVYEFLFPIFGAGFVVCNGRGASGAIQVSP
ncbi:MULTISPECIES: hypothetical protein [unclassified Streptomyces]|uniref:hypothetical protein n=1 Tax=unclassified Streptomyces TaxID=2593676 RepID=UPI0036686201